VTTERFTAKQGQCLAFLYYYAKLNGRPAAEVDVARYFGVTPESAHGMIVTLEKRGLISKVPGQARSIRLLLSRAELPDLE
jgi:DNA-binding MarR family transcriptional regulator